MGKPSRRPSRVNRQKRERVRFTANGSELTVTIFTSPVTAERSGLQEEVRLVRAALLYADKIELVSPVLAMVRGMDELGASDDPRVCVEMMKMLASTEFGASKLAPAGKDVSELITAMEGLAALESLPRDRRRDLPGTTRSQVQEMVGGWRTVRQKFHEKMAAEAERNWKKFGASDIAAAIDDGLVLIPDGALPADDEGEFSQELFVTNLVEALSSPGKNVLFDDEMRRMVSLMVKEGYLQPEAISMERTLRASMGTGLLARLPTFPQATFSAIKACRGELREPLTRYRISLDNYRAMLTSDAYSSGLEADLDDLYRDSVVPTLTDLQGQLSESSLVQEAAKLLVRSPRDVAQGIAGPVMMTFAGAQMDWSGVVTATTALSAGTIGAVGKAALDRRARMEHARQHELYYMLAVNGELECNAQANRQSDRN